ncbi:MAG TPA: hypothetical protein VK679_00025 [Gemmatimonadaceae bacterium]|jgi:hypothetical protein|nr:hypothetical protein [Gemmatimonadaceae bacterium]
MRGSLILLAALMACSDSSGPPHAPVLTTQLSSTAVGINGVLAVTLSASNPTDTTEQIAYTTPEPVYAEIKLGGQWRSGFVAGGFGGIDTLVLPSGADTALGVVSVLFTPPAQQSLAPAALSDNESFAIAPGMYDVRACFTPPGPTGAQGGSVVQGTCGNGVSFDLTP